MKRQWENEELIEHWILGPWDLAQVGNKTGATRLGFAVLLKFFQREGRFPFFKNEIPGVVLSFVGKQVDVDASAYLQYDWQGRTIKDHRAEIRRLLGFREFAVADAEQMQQWFITEVLPQEHQEERLREQVYQWLKRQHLEPPTPDRLTRLIRSALHTFEQQLYDATFARLSESSRSALEPLLQIEIVAPEASEEVSQTSSDSAASRAQTTSTLQLIRQDPGRIRVTVSIWEKHTLRMRS
jgi:hypothetical protein